MRNRLRKLFLITTLAFFTLLIGTDAIIAKEKKVGVKLLRDDLFSICFSNPEMGWACGRNGTIIHTRDGGSSWQLQKSKTDYTLSAITFISDKEGWAAGDQGTILFTRDGGNTWTRQDCPVSNFFLMDVCFVSPLKGWIVTERTHILATVDGGQNWTIQHEDRDYILKSISFADDLNGWAAGEYGYVYHTSDGGVSWNKQAGHFDISDETGDMVGDPYLYDIVAVDPNTAWAAGIDGRVIKTTDGGETWAPITVGLPDTDQALYFCIAKYGNNGIIIGGDGIVLASEDNGSSWARPEFQPDAGYGWFYDITPSDSNSYIAVGWGGSIYRKQGKSVWKKIIRK